MKSLRTAASMLIILGLTVIWISLYQLKPTSKIQSQIKTSLNLKKSQDLYQRSLRKMSFQQWCTMFNKVYENQNEKYYRKHIYLKNCLKIHLHNKQYQRGLKTWFMALNSHSDLSQTEFVDIYTWKNTELKFTTSCQGSIMDAPNPPPTLDWGTTVTESKDQGKQCGQDWAMVAASAVESLYALKVGSTPIQFSIQQLLQCSGDYGNEGCQGGFMDQAFWYIIDYGIATRISYPQRKVSACKYVPNMKFTSFSRCARVPSRNYSKLLSAIVQQPVSVGLNQPEDMLNYGGGVYDGDCTSEINHGMLLTGYGEEEGNPYWILRNSLGKSWGINGYIYLKRLLIDGEGKCGIHLVASVPQNLK